ncbi:uncharacterized protein [Watersipora subatra]|uniref:uncharacterized protein isoform X2 n=1 Tax=Watersipora subatra TaxID=2589382 RepID=UPI00355BFA44
MVMFSHATSHAKSSKKNTFTRRSLSIETGVIPPKSDIIGKDKNGNINYPYSIKQPVFAQRRMHRSKSQNDMHTYTQEHENIVKYLSATWQSVKRDLDNKKNDSSAEGGTVYYIEKELNPVLKDFMPFDLERFLADRLYQKYLPSS